MTKRQKTILLKRFKSFAWRLGMVILAMWIDFATENIGLFNLPAEATVLLGLVLGEISKYLNSKK